jgi:hypothetical protein
MPEHLEKHTLDKPAQELLEKLGKWLEHNGTFVPGVEKLETCTSEGLNEEVGELYRKMIVLFGQIQGTGDVSRNTCYYAQY